MHPWVRLAALLLLVAAQGAFAGSFSVSPLGVTIPSRDAAGSVTVTNAADQPVVIQVRTQAWSQRDGKEVREDTREVIVNPPIFRLGPGEQQLVRFASRMGAPREDESAYRVIFSEVPQRDAPRTEPGFTIALAMDIPLYLEPLAPPRAEPVRWQAERTASGVRVSVDNPGNLHYRLVNLEFAAGMESLHQQGNLVVLPRSRLVFEFAKPARDATAIKLTAEDLAGHPVSLDIALSPAP